ncbi:MAG: carboxypeptidase-like regulatory domain-containing protein, partial [Candidatus Bathyarchaeia archaeon]
MNHHSLKKICSIAAILSIILLVAAPLAVTAQWAYPPGEWKFKIVDDWGKPVSGAVAYLYNSTKPLSWTGTWSFENWPLVKWGEADKDGWVTIPELPGNAWDRAATDWEINYTLIIKLKIGTETTPITIFNYTVLKIGPQTGTPQAIGLYTLLNATTIEGTYPGKSWITSPKTVDSTATVGGKKYGVYEVWLYYVTMQFQDELGFPIAGAELRVFYNSSYNGKTYIQNTPVTGWVRKLYGKYFTNGTVGSEFVKSNTLTGGIAPYTPNLKVGWVVLRLPRINDTTGAGSSLVNNMTFVLLYKTNTTVLRITYEEGDLAPNGTYVITVDNVEWTQVTLLDCYGNNWWTMKAEVYAFDTAFKNLFPLAATRIAPGIFALRYPVPAVGTTTIRLAVEWYFSTVAIANYTVGGGVDYLEGGVDVTCNMTWVDVNFWSAAELPQQVSEFAAKIWLPATMGFRKEAPLTFWWNGRNGFVVLPDMEFYAGPNPSTMDQLDPYGVASAMGFDDFYEDMSQYFGAAGGFGGQGWLPTREVGWVDFEVWYEGVKVLDTYVEGSTLKLICCEASPPYSTTCHYNFTLKIYEIGFRIILEACGLKMDAPTGVPFFFTHANPELGLVGPKAVTDGKVDIVKAPIGNYSNFAIVWQMSLLRPYKILYYNGTADVELKEPIKLTANMRNIQLYFKLWNLTIDTWSQDPFRIVNVDVTLFSVSDFGIAPGMGITKRMIEQIIDEHSIYSKYVLPPGWKIFKIDVDQYGYPVIYYHTTTKTNYWNDHPSWTFLPEKDYWIWVNVPSDAQKAMNAGFRAIDANATLYWSGDPWNKPLRLSACYGNSNPYIVYTYVYNPKIALKTACGAPLVFDETMNSALILAEPWNTGNQLFSMQQIDPTSLVTIGTPSGVASAPYNAYLIRKNATDQSGVVTISSVNASSVSSPNDPDLWNPTTGWVAKKYPNQSRYLIGESKGTWQIAGVASPVKKTTPEYRIMVYYKGVLVYNASTALSNPYVSKEHTLTTSVYPYVFRVTNDPLKGGTIFGIANIKVTVYWAGLNVTWWPTKHLTYETAPIEFSLLNASKLDKGFNMSVVKRLWGPVQVVTRYLENIPYQPVPPYFSSMVVVESAMTDSNGKATFLIPVWNYSVTPKIYTWMADDGSASPQLANYMNGPRHPWNKTAGPLSIFLFTAGEEGRTGALFGTPVYANFTTVPGVTNNIPDKDVPRLVGVLTASAYGRWIQHSMNATGLVNPATKTWENTRVKLTFSDGSSVYKDGVSLNTTYRSAYKGNWWAGVGMLGGGAYQHRTPDSETGTTVSPPQPAANCYAKAEERIIANDIGVVVRNLDKVGLPNQKVTITRDAIYVDSTKIADSKVLMEDWTPTKPNADPTDYYVLYLRSTPSNILWGIYDFTVKTENLTKGMTNTLLKLNDPQFLVEKLEGGDVDWKSGMVYLDWPARLRVTILTEDGKPLEKAWVYVVDAYTRGNVTAAITDNYGHAGTLFVGAGNAAEHLKIEPGDRVDIGFNLLRGWYWLDEHKRLSGIAVNKNWDIAPYGDEEPEQPIGAEWIQQITYPEEEGKTGWARFYGRYYVVVYYKPAGCSEVQGPVVSEVVFDSYTAEGQFQYIYLGIHPEALAPTSEYAAGQAKNYKASVRDLRISFADASGRPLTGVSVKAKHPVYGWESELAKAISVETNTATLEKVPMKEGTSYKIDVEWTSKYGTKATGTASVTAAETSISLPIYDVTLRLLTPRGAPLVGVPVKVAGVDVGATSATGEVMVPQIPPGTYSVAASWLETALSLPSLVVSAPGPVTLTPTNLHVLTVRVIGAQGQALEGATVRVTKGAIEVTRLTDKDGKAQIELPDASYNIEVTYGQFSKTDSVTMTADTLKTFNLDVFIEFL